MPGLLKGMKAILEEQGFNEEVNLPAECPAFKCKDLRASCCCCQILFNQPDFIAQKPALFELVESHGHIAFFYPKFHCELNFIEQSWGAAKHHYRRLPLTHNEKWTGMLRPPLMQLIYSKCGGVCILFNFEQLCQLIQTQICKLFSMVHACIQIGTKWFSVYLGQQKIPWP